MAEKDKAKEPYDITRWVSEETLDRLGFVKRHHDFPVPSERAFEAFEGPLEVRGEIANFRHEIYFGEYFEKTKSCTAVLSSEMKDLAGMKAEGFNYWYVTNVYIPKQVKQGGLGHLKIFIIYKELLKEENRVDSKKLEETLLNLHKKPIDRNLRERLRRKWEKL